jgi:AbrB family looped-hinge helix DNA binding protein
MAVQRLSSKNQIVIPKEARQAMGVKGGDELLVVVKDDLTIVMQKPKRYSSVLRGLAKGTFSCLVVLVQFKLNRPN